MFSCRACLTNKALEDLADLPCSCLCCTSCTATSVSRQLQQQRQGSMRQNHHPTNNNNHSHDRTTDRQPRFSKGDAVLYLNRMGVFVEATVQQVDRSCQPPQYGILLPGAGDLRFTEGHRLYAGDSGAQRQGAWESLRIGCPVCCGALQLTDARAAAPGAVRSWEAACTQAWLDANGVIACPHAGCGALILRQPADAAQSPDGAPHTRPHAHAGAANPVADGHWRQHRFRCAACSRDFCDACRAAPYHAGLTCAQARAPDCRLCGGKVGEGRLEALLPSAARRHAERQANDHGAADDIICIDMEPGPAGDAGAGGLAAARAAAEAEAQRVVGLATARELRAALQALAVDAGWCLERTELEQAVVHWGLHTCAARECAGKVAGACTQKLPCGHWCCGVRGEEAHPGCVECAAEGRGRAGPSAGSAGAAAASDCAFCFCALPSGPCIQLTCGHLCHLECALGRLSAGYPGPHISFNHLFCPLCGTGEERHSSVQVCTGPVHLDHPSLGRALAPALALRAEVVSAAKARLRMEAGLLEAPELAPGGRYHGRPGDFALAKLLFFQCSQCSKPYFGGLRSCGAAGAAGPGPAAAAAAYDKQELLCGDCCARAAGSNCPRHGTAYIEWKCRYCCSLASWFCFGTTHMCHECHSDGTYMRHQIKPCTPATCRLGAQPHPPPGQEACLGCGMCRAGL